MAVTTFGSFTGIDEPRLEPTSGLAGDNASTVAKNAAPNLLTGDLRTSGGQ